MKIRTSYIVLMICLAAFNSGCKKWLDVNTNPNVAQDVPEELLLPSAQIAIASALGAELQVRGGIWGQHWTQSPASSQYKVYEQYSPTANNFDVAWGLLYSDGLMDLKVLENKARKSGKKEYLAVSKILQAYAFQLATDAWGDIPFSEALRGAVADGGIVSPKYDAQENIYMGITLMLDSARMMIDELANATHGDVSGDLIYGGDLSKWKKFANTLELKVYLRLTGISLPAAEAGVAKISADPDGFIGEGDDALIKYTATAQNQNPLYAEIVGLGRTQNLVASATVVNEMNDNSDLRVYVLFNPAGASVVGIPQGAYTLPSSTPVSPPSSYTGALGLAAEGDITATAPVRFITSYESLFLQAEAQARWGSGGEDEYFDAIESSFMSMSSQLSEIIGVSGAEAYNSYINGDTALGTTPSEYSVYPSSTEDRIKFIITQKWLAMTGTQSFEAWTEWRRTGYPDFFTYSVNSIIGQKFPARFLYPNTELTRNGNFPGQKQITDKVWWDIQ